MTVTQRHDRCGVEIAGESHAQVAAAVAAHARTCGAFDWRPQYWRENALRMEANRKAKSEKGTTAEYDRATSRRLARDGDPSTTDRSRRKGMM